MIAFDQVGGGPRQDLAVRVDKSHRDVVAAAVSVRRGERQPVGADDLADVSPPRPGDLLGADRTLRLLTELKRNGSEVRGAAPLT